MSNTGTPGPNQAPNQAAGPGPQNRPGRMTAVMRAMTQVAGPKVLRIGLVSGGRIIEERVIKQRTTVTVGTNERSTFVIAAANLPPQFKVFELVGSEYVLNFLDGMTGRVALPTGITDLASLKGQARRAGPAYQVKLTDDARGKIVIGDTTFLFQFVAPPPVAQRPQLPLSVKGGLASQIDWNLTVLAAFSFLLHFGTIGVSARWDPEVSDEVTVGLLEMARDSIPPVDVEQPKPDVDKDPQDVKPDPTKAVPTVKAANTATAANPNAAAAAEAKQVAGLVDEADKMLLLKLGALGGGPGMGDVLKGDNAAPVDLKGIASQGTGVGAGNGNGLNIGTGNTGPVRPGENSTLTGIQGGNTGTVATSAGPEKRVIPVGDVSGGGASSSVPIANAEAKIRGLAPRARACYNKAIGADPATAGQGRVGLTIKVGPSGEVEGVSVSNSGVAPSVASCIAGAARGLTFDAPGASGGTISTAFNFVQQAPR